MSTLYMSAHTLQILPIVSRIPPTGKISPRGSALKTRIVSGSHHLVVQISAHLNAVTSQRTECTQSIDLTCDKYLIS